MIKQIKMFINRNRSQRFNSVYVKQNDLLSQYPIHNSQSIDSESSWGFFIEMEAIPSPSDIKCANQKIKTNTFLSLSFDFATIDCNDIIMLIDQSMAKLNYIMCRPTVDSFYYVD